jgi:uncharacterized membrane protein
MNTPTVGQALRVGLARTVIAFILGGAIAYLLGRFFVIHRFSDVVFDQPWPAPSGLTEMVLSTIVAGLVAMVFSTDGLLIALVVIGIFFVLFLELRGKEVIPREWWGW